MTKPASTESQRVTRVLLLSSPQFQSAYDAVGGVTSSPASDWQSQYRELEKKVLEDLAARWKSRFAPECRISTLRSPSLLPPPEDKAANAGLVRAVLVRETGALPESTYERIRMGPPFLYFDFLAIYVYASDSATRETGSRNSWLSRFAPSPKDGREKDSTSGSLSNEDVARVEQATSSLQDLGFRVIFEDENRRWAVSKSGAGTTYCYSTPQLDALAEAEVRRGERRPQESNADPVREFTIPSHFAPYTGPVGEDVKGLISELLRIGSVDGYLSLKPGGAFNAQRRNVRAREIGEALNERGGIGLMQLACKRVSSTLGVGRGRELEAAWADIGDWRP